MGPSHAVHSTCLRIVLEVANHFGDGFKSVFEELVEAPQEVDGFAQTAEDAYLMFCVRASKFTKL